MTDVFDAVHDWVFRSGLPWWIRHAWDEHHGGFVETFDLTGADGRAEFKRSRVAARQVYALSHARMLGVDGASAAAERGFRYLIDQGWADGPPRTIRRDGSVLDPTPDLYDHAFLAFAFAWRHKAFGDSASRDALARIFDVIETRFPHNLGGFHNSLPAAGWRLQNPHMHLTEASLAAFEATGEARYRKLGETLIALFRTSFYDARTQTLAERFTDDWRRAPGEAGRTIEPGHQLEWAWILGEARRLFDSDTAAEMRGLVAFAERYGVDPASGAVFNEIRDDGVPIDRGSRTWPNTERLKASIALHDLDGADPEPALRQSLGCLFGRYLSPAPLGLWTDAFDGEGTPLSASAPSSTLYHVLLAFSEVLRFRSAR
jgi:N-acylglucosamine 2-epimerase/mannose-6-phosphate isomerase